MHTLLRCCDYRLFIFRSLPPSPFLAGEIIVCVCVGKGVCGVSPCLFVSLKHACSHSQTLTDGVAIPRTSDTVKMEEEESDDDGAVCCSSSHCVAVCCNEACPGSWRWKEQSTDVFVSPRILFANSVKE